jgi:effector-binding domain-containing protein
VRKIILCIIAFIFILAFAQNMYAKGVATSKIKVEIKEVEPFVYCSLRHKGPFSDMENVINDLLTTMKSMNIFPQGPMMGIYHTIPGPNDPENTEMEWEVGFPISEQSYAQAPEEIQEKLERKTWEYTLVASAVYTGPYEETGEAITDIFEWMEANGYDKAGPVLEIYLDAGTPDPSSATNKTEIWIPCKK